MEPKEEKRPKRARIGDNRFVGSSTGTTSGYNRPVFESKPKFENTESEGTTGSYTPRDNQENGSSTYQRREYNNYNSYNRQNGYNNYRQGGYNNNGGYNRQDGYNNGGYNRQNNGYSNRSYTPRPSTPQTTGVPVEGAETTSAETEGATEGQQPQQRSYNNYRQSGYNNYRQSGYNNNRQGGYNNNRQGGYNNNRQGGYNNYQTDYNNEQNGGQPRQGGYNNRQGGYNNNRQGGYNNNRQGGQRPFGKQMQRPGKSFVPRQKRIEYEMPIPDPDEQIRLNKYMANAGICSRREADEFIKQGLVKVNGEVVTELGTKITHSDTVEYDEKIVTLESKCYILLNKPKDCVTTSDDPNGRTTVLDLVKGACNERIYPVGRLDRNTTGVLLLTNDGDLASKLTHPKYVKKKIYHVWTDKDISEDDMQAIADGIELEDGEIHADAISYATDTDRNQAGIEIH
ncbi:MAG: RNA-binding S4 domain-containing protein, partial [Muribaculum sp.]|nr:RNA-binding S4 domain-containing protein [Muribaculum sp.]